MLEGMARLDLLVLSACLPGLILTVALLARLMTWFFKRFYAVTFHGILGIVLATTLVIIPTTYTDVGEVFPHCAAPEDWPGLLPGPAGPENSKRNHIKKWTAFLGSPLFYSGSTANPASQSFCKLIRIPSLAWYQVRPPWK